MVLSRYLFLALTMWSTACWSQAGPYVHERQDPLAMRLPAGLSCARLEVVSEGRILVPLPFRGSHWLEGRPGSEYVLVARNDCNRRILAVLSVDGLNVLDGQSATTDQGGYVIDPGSSVHVAGWRKSQQEVSSFYFSSPSDSYAGRTGNSRNVGVIGAAFFTEKLPSAPNLPMMTAPPGLGSMGPKPKAGEGATRLELSPSDPAVASRSTPAPALQSAPSLGTGHGRRMESLTRSVDFEREPYALHVSSLRYESRSRLEEIGVLPRLRNTRPDTNPNPFPAQPFFTPDPPSR